MYCTVVSIVARPQWQGPQFLSRFEKSVARPNLMSLATCQRETVALYFKKGNNFLKLITERDRERERFELETVRLINPVVASQPAMQSKLINSWPSLTPS